MLNPSNEKAMEFESIYWIIRKVQEDQWLEEIQLIDAFRNFDLK